LIQTSVHFLQFNRIAELTCFPLKNAVALVLISVVYHKYFYPFFINDDLTIALDRYLLIVSDVKSELLDPSASVILRKSYFLKAIVFKVPVQQLLLCTIQILAELLF